MFVVCMSMEVTAIHTEELPYLAVHYFQTCRMRHWISQEVFLSPNFLLLKVYSTVVNIGIDFVPCSYPSAEALDHIPLPAGFVKGTPSGTEGILQYLRSIAEVDTSISSSTQGERAALSVLAETVITEAIQYLLWGHADCYSKFTYPIMMDSMSRPFGDVYCAGQRAQWTNRDCELINAKLKNLLKYLNSKIRYNKFFFSNDRPSMCDIVLYSHLSVLLSVPDKFVPFFFVKDTSDDTVEMLHRLKSYLLDFDDWLWQLNAKRAEQIEPSAPLHSALVAAAGDVATVPAGEGAAGEATLDTSSPSKPLLGTDKRQNLAFLGIVAATMAGVVMLTRNT